MFDSKHIEAYNQIKAPDGLKDRILAQEQTTAGKGRTVHVDFRKVALVAACIAVMFSAVIGMSVNGRTGITVNGTPLKSNTAVYVSAGNARMVMAADALIEIELEVKKDSTCFVHGGTLLVSYDDGTITEVAEGEQYRTDGTQSLIWQVYVPDTQSEYTLSVQTAKGTRTLSLRYSTENGWFVESDN